MQEKVKESVSEGKTSESPPSGQEQTGHPTWGAYALQLTQGGYRRPREGRNDDKAHPPIHPTKLAAALVGDRARLYELVARHFVACCSEDALANEVAVTIEISCEHFTTKGQSVVARNYLEVLNLCATPDAAGVARAWEGDANSTTGVKQAPSTLGR